MGIMVCSLSGVMQDLYHQPYQYFLGVGHGVQVSDLEFQFGWLVFRSSAISNASDGTRKA